MNSMLRIQVRVAAKQAQTDLRAVRTQIRGIAADAAKLNAAASSINRVNRSAAMFGMTAKRNTGHFRSMNGQLRTTMKLNKEHRGILGGLNTALNGTATVASKGLIGMSKNLQWVGRQLNFNFTIPLAIASGAAMKWALDTEAAFTRVRKVYGDGSRAASEYASELDKIAEGTRLLSDYFGVAQADVNQLAAEFAAAGMEGGALLRSVQTGLELQILGDYDSPTDVFAGLLTIQKAFRLTSEGTAAVIALLNTVENATAASLPGLVEGLEKAGASAAGMGVDFRQLSAAIAAMTPTAGSPEEIGTSLKTIISRIAQPTAQIAEAFAGIGVNIDEMKNQGIDAMEIIEEMAWATEELSDAERSRLASILGGRRQYNRVLALWDDMTDAASDYQRVLELLDPANDFKNIEMAQKEIMTLLESDPRKLEIVTNQLKNLAIDAITPLIPLLISLVAVLRNVFKWFNDLDPAIQRFAAVALVGVAAVGMLAQFIGSLGLLFGTFANFLLKPILLLSTFGKQIVSVLVPLGRAMGALVVSPWGLALAAAAGILYAFNDDISDALSSLWSFIVRGFNSLPENIANAMRSIVNIIARTVEIIANFFSQLFGGGSFSVGNGVSANVPRPAKGENGGVPKFHSGGIVEGYGEVPAVLKAGEMVLTAEQQAKLFKMATQGIRDSRTNSIRSEQIATVEAGAPGSGATLAGLFAELDKLNGLLAGVETEMEAQQAIVDAVENEYDRAQQAVTDFEKTLEPLEAELDTLNQTLSEAETRLNELASVPITGMGAMSDAIFENELAIKKLRLEMLQLEDGGMTFDQIRDRISALNGDIETLRAQMTSLRDAGAGSEILSVYEDQIAALEAQKQGLRDSADEASALEDQIAELERAGQILQLTQDITFDPLVRQIDQMVNGVDEMDFADIIAQIAEQKQIIDETTATIGEQQEKYDEQLAILDMLKARETEIGELRDQEKAKLDSIKDTYSDIQDAIRDIEALINETIQAQEALNSAAAAGGGAGGGAGAGAGGGLGGLTGDFDEPILPDLGIDELGLDAQLERLREMVEQQWEDFDLLEPLKKEWERAKAWFEGLEIPPDVIKGIAAGAGVLLAGSLFGPWGVAIAGALTAWYFFGDEIGGVLDDIGASDTWDTITGAVERVGRAFMDWLNPIIEQMTPLWGELVELGESAWRAMKELSEVLAPLGVAFLLALEYLSPFIGAITGFVASTVLNILIQMFTTLFDIITLISALLTGDFATAWESLKSMMESFVDLFLVPFENAKEVLDEHVGELLSDMWQAGIDIMGGLAEGLAEGFIAVFTWIGEMPGKIMDKIKELFGIASPSTKMMAIGVDIIAGLLLGVATKAVELFTWFTNLPGKILGFFVEISLLLIGKGKQLLGGLLTGIGEKWLEIAGWLGGIGSRAITAIGNLGQFLVGKGKQILWGLWEGAKSKLTEILGWIGGIGDRILNGIPNLGSKLWSKGHSLISGLTNGMKAAWNSFADWWNSKIGGLSVTVPGWVPGFGGKGVSAPSMPRLHTGGVVQGMGEVRAILQAGEMVITKRQQAQLFNMANGVKSNRSGNVISNSSGGRTLNFYGNLEFPNVRSGEDADEFVTNLEALAGAGS